LHLSACSWDADRFSGAREQERAISAEWRTSREKRDSQLPFEYDSLTGLLNRRGFIERAYAEPREHRQNRYCAICTWIISSRSTIPTAIRGDDALIGLSAISRASQRGRGDRRIGGIEFAAFFSRDPDFEARFLRTFERKTPSTTGSGGLQLEVSYGLGASPVPQGWKYSVLAGPQAPLRGQAPPSAGGLRTK
jgi:GGDEF domain-containing protein